jgi:hypothetical protein
VLKNPSTKEERYETLICEKRVQEILEANQAELAGVLLAGTTDQAKYERARWLPTKSRWLPTKYRLLVRQPRACQAAHHSLRYIRLRPNVCHHSAETSPGGNGIIS